MSFWNRSSKHQHIVEPAAKRISTPAGQRLSVILGGGDDQKQSRGSHRASMRKPDGIVTAAALGDAPRESTEEQSQNSSGYSYNVWSDGEKFKVLRDNPTVARRGGWKRILMILAILIAAIIALAVGLAVGLKKKGTNSDTASQPPSDPAAPNTNPTATASSPSATSTPENFPLGSYSMVTFLDTVQTNCTANPATWTCNPYTTFNSDPLKAVATFNWIISSSSPDKYKISSTENPFSISFKNEDLKIIDEGEETERYHFQLSQTKTVTPSESLTDDDDADTECEFADTSLQAFLYTKMASTYPDTEKGHPDGNPDFPLWPFAVRVEQVASGGENVPACHKVSNGEPGDEITKGLEAQDASGLCSCLYKNWRTPLP